MQFSFLPTAPAPLTLDAGGLIPLLDVAGFVEDGNGVRPGVLVADDPLEVVTQGVVVPVVLAEELLQGPRRHASVQRDRFDALLGDVRELAGDVEKRAALSNWHQSRRYVGRHRCRRRRQLQTQLSQSVMRFGQLGGV